MRYAAGHKARTRAKIVQAAGKVFRREGYHAAGIDMVMEEAGLTAGGFYAHFPSKAALLAEALAPAAAGVPHDQERDDETGRTRTEAFIDRYLTPRHMRDTEGGCPLPALASEVARTGGPVKASFEAIVRDLTARLKEQADGKLSEDRALAILALCVGGLSLARSVQDEALGERILASCRDLARASLVDLTEPQTPASARQHKSN